ncbi:MAG: ABC transporter ATP-binding protein [Desulfatirhabdiaceae bacterium]
MNTLLKLENVHAGYGKARVLQGVSLTVGEGDSIALIGRNGVGKTTVVNAILGIANVYEGGIWLSQQKQGRLRNYTASRLGISVVPQGRRIIPNLTIEENLVLGSAVKREGHWNLNTVYKLFPILEERAQTPGTALSGGQQQMLAIGRALMANPALLILDEPSEGLAPVIVDQLAEIFTQLVKGGTAVLLIEQNLTLVARVATEYHVISKGNIVENGTLEGRNVQDLHRYIMI